MGLTGPGQQGPRSRRLTRAMLHKAALWRSRFAADACCSESACSSRPRSLCGRQKGRQQMIFSDRLVVAGDGSSQCSVALSHAAATRRRRRLQDLFAARILGFIAYLRLRWHRRRPQCCCHDVLKTGHAVRGAVARSCADRRPLIAAVRRKDSAGGRLWRRRRRRAGRRRRRVWRARRCGNQVRPCRQVDLRTMQSGWLT